MRRSQIIVRYMAEHGHSRLGKGSRRTGIRGTRSRQPGPEGCGQHLRKLPYVDGHRIAFAGFSWGAMLGLLASGATWGNALLAGTRFRAIVAFYPGCFDIRPSRRTAVRASSTGHRHAPGKPVEWHTYPGATHCWDCQNLDGFRKTDFTGTAVEYRYDREVFKDSAERMFAFINQSAAAKR